MGTKPLWNTRNERVYTSVQHRPPPAAPMLSRNNLDTAMAWVGVALGASFALFLIALVPVLQAVRQVALEVAALVYTIREEVPDTAAALRLPALEVTDTIEEMGSLSSELTDGVRASVRSFSAAANLTTSGAEYLKETVNNEVVPRAQQLGKLAGRRVHTVVAEAVEMNAGSTDYSQPIISQTAEATRDVVVKVRKAAVGAKAARALAKLVRMTRD
eukprot:CAMPEP_0198200550 /NCGR_PEP_ID=MMETSP1445-20131203/3556_1 /TAXON_ID=36898 /ORGANISM="Pyramimonas sp., Strain CCMP2087" /LENGTH=215 /DNA_ID=CAMNT_0043870663 /DNA_START=586 /DNA_END=1233 /DNA_ORIENTATION=+